MDDNEFTQQDAANIVREEILPMFIKSNFDYNVINEYINNMAFNYLDSLRVLKDGKVVLYGEKSSADPTEALYQMLLITLTIGKELQNLDIEYAMKELSSKCVTVH